MPKENITCSVTDGFRAEVSWSQAGWVQVATVNQNSPMTLPGGPLQPEGPFDGFRVTLERDGVNRMIRALRKARDAAFGRDE